MTGKYDFKRSFYYDVEKSVERNKVTFILGPRKCGKTVCMEQLADSIKTAVYVDFKQKSDDEGFDVFLKIRESIQNDERVIYLLDEITYAPNPEKMICMFAQMFSEYDTNQVRVVFAGSQSLALEAWGHTAFAGCAGYIRPDFLSYGEWLAYKQIEGASAESYEQFLYGAMDFYGIDSMQDYLQGCINETILSNTKTSNYIYGNDCSLLNADILMDICYATLFTLHNHVSNAAFMKKDGLKEDIRAYFADVCASLDLDARIGRSFISRYNSFKRRDLQILEQAFLFLRNCGLITVTPVSNDLEHVPDLEWELERTAYGDSPRINVKDELFRSFNMCIRYPVFYMAILKDILGDQMPERLPHGLLGSIVECQVRGMLPEKGSCEYRDQSGNEVDYVNVVDRAAVEISIANKSLKGTHFDCLPEDMQCLLLTKDRSGIVQGVQQVPYYVFLRGTGDGMENLREKGTPCMEPDTGEGERD